MRLSLQLFLLAAGLQLAAVPVYSQQKSPEAEIAESQRRLEQIRRERSRLREDMERLRSQVHSLSSELRNLERQVEASAELMKELNYQIEQRQQQIEDNTRELLTTRDRLAEVKALLHHRLRSLYKRGPLHTAKVLLSAESFSELLRRYQYLFVVAQRDQTLVREVRLLESQLAARERALRQSLQEMERMQLLKAEEHAHLAALEEEQKRSLSSVRARERTTSRRIEQLENDERRLRALIAELARRERRRESAGSESAGTLTTSDMGRLGWPVSGPLLYRFGRTTRPNGTVLRWNGIGIASAPGTPVHAVEEGTVVLAGPFEGYGPTVILSHGGGYYSLYLYLQSIAVREDERVSRSQRLGTVGGELTPEGPHIEFQIRAPGGQAVDPLVWLQKRNP